MFFLDRAFDFVVRRGSLTVNDARGRTTRFGDGMGKSVTIRLNDKFLQRRIFRDPGLAIGEAYMDGRLDIEEGTVFDFLDLLSSNIAASGNHPLHRVVAGIEILFKRFQQNNPIAKKRRPPL